MTFSNFTLISPLECTDDKENVTAFQDPVITLPSYPWKGVAVNHVRTGFLYDAPKTNNVKSQCQKLFEVEMLWKGGLKLYGA